MQHKLYTFKQECNKKVIHLVQKTLMSFKTNVKFFFLTNSGCQGTTDYTVTMKTVDEK